MKYLTFLFFLLLTMPPGICQVNTDSIFQKLTSYPDSQQARQANDISFQLRAEDPDASREMALKARTAALKAANGFETGRSYYNEGNAFMAAGEYNKALIQLDSAENIFSALNNLSFKAKALNSKGIIYGQIGDFKKAIDVHLAGLAINEKIRDDKGIAKSLNNIGAVYQGFKEYSRALSYFQRAFDQHKKNNDMKNAVMSLSNVGAMYSAMRDFDNALSVHQEALKLCEPTGDELTLAAIYANLGADLIETGKIKESLQYQMKSLSLKKKIGDKAGESVSLLNIGQCYVELKQYPTAERYLNESLELAKKLDYAENIQNAHLYLSQLYEVLGQPNKSLIHFKQYTSIKDSLFNEDKAKDIGKLEAKFEIEKAQEEMLRKQDEEQRAALEQMNRRNRLQYSGILIFIICLLIGAFVSGKFDLPSVIAKGLIFFTFLIFFEFLLLLLEPGIESISNSVPLIKLGCNAAVALFISPLHSFLESKLKSKLRLENRAGGHI